MYRVVHIEYIEEGALSERILYRTVSLDNAITMRSWYDRIPRRVFDLTGRTIGGYYVQDKAGSFVEHRRT